MYIRNTKDEMADADRELSVINTLFPKLSRKEQKLIFCSLNAAFIAAQLPSPQQKQNNIVEISSGTTKRPIHQKIRTG